MRLANIRGTFIQNFNDAFNWHGAENLADLVNSLGWKALDLLILVLVISVFIASIFFK